jgi:YfiH family protein
LRKIVTTQAPLTELKLNPDWLVPDWPAPSQVHAVCTTRAGGCSTSPYNSFNLGDHVGDNPLHVAANRAVLEHATGARAVFLSQVHGTHVEYLTAETLNGTVADAAQTTEVGVACTVMVADCLPVLFTNAQGTWVAAAHAGWRGLAGEAGEAGQGVLEKVLEHFRALAPVHPAQGAIDVIAWLGPCIGPTAFEVGGEVRDRFVANDAAAAAFFTPTLQGKWLANLAGLARQRLRQLGVTAIYGNDGSEIWCTVNQPSRFFSYRRDGVSGRLAASIWLR